MRMIRILPLPLLALSLLSLHYPLINSQQSQTNLPLDTIVPVTISASSGFPKAFALPSSDKMLSVSVALCSNVQPVPTFSVSNGSGTGGGPWHLSFDEGIGTWSGGTPAGSSLVVSLAEGAASSETWSFEVAVSDGAPLNRNLGELPLLGDTTGSQALLFSPAFSPPTYVSPSYPNFTLPGGNLTTPDPPPLTAQPNFSLILAPTAQLEQQLGGNISLSGCAIRAAAGKIDGAWLGTNGTGGVNGSASLVLRDKGGWRSQWIIEGLKASTNYTAVVVQDGGAVSSPIYAFTKSSSFPCPLVHSLPFCPLISYSVPLPPPPGGATTYTASNVPTNITSTLLDSLSNFTTVLLTFPCGREYYSPIQSCESCADAYRVWACAVSFPRCSEIPPPLSSALAAQPSATKSSDWAKLIPTPALLPHPPAAVRNQAMPDISSTTAYNELLPCIETCQMVDRACPPVFTWSCPFASVNANWSYGVGFIDGWDGDQGRGIPGVAQDRWGVSWCNG